MPLNAKDYIFEVSWEVCNKIGGIYTVLSTKAKVLHKLYKDHFIFIGPDVWTTETPARDFIESDSLLRGWRKVASLPEGVSVRVGRWAVPGRPLAILVKFDAMYASKDEAYGRMWERFGVDSLHAYGDYDEACAFGRAAAAVIESLVNYWQADGTHFTAHFDEWTTGMGLLTVKDRLPEVATVFTTHATSIGRSICGNGKALYEYMDGYNGYQMAGELNMEAKHSLEAAAAKNADCFTTVSDVTARECEQLLERRPDVVTPNGFEADFVPASKGLTEARNRARKALLDVAGALLGETLGKDTFLIATSGRCEYRNKGLDVFCDAMARLADEHPSRRVVAFVMVPAWCAGAREDLQAALAAGNNNGLPDPVLTHNLHNYNDDPVNNHIHRLGFADWRLGSKVSIIYVPCYLRGDDGIFNMSYYDLLCGFDTTVFPSYYEPWGYTPLESVAFGVPTITTSLSGFGQWLATSVGNTFGHSGAIAVQRTDSNYDAVVNDICQGVNTLMTATAREMKTIVAAARHTAAEASWNNFITYYSMAYDVAQLNNRQDNTKNKK